MNRRFNPQKLENLNNPQRLEMIPPGYIWKKLNPAAHSVKVEIGAGTGIFSRAFQNLSGTGKTWALDISDVMVDWMIENITSGNPDIIPLKTDGILLPLADSAADIVFMITVHHELDNPPATLKEANRILNNSGKIFIVDWDMSDTGHGPSKDIRYRPEEVAAQLTEAGFTNIEIDTGIPSFFLLTADK